MAAKDPGGGGFMTFLFRVFSFSYRAERREASATLD